MGVDLLRVFQVLGYFSACMIGIYRLTMNHLYPKERIIYVWASVITLYFGLVYLVTQLNVSFKWFPTVDLHGLVRLGHPFLIGVIVLFMIYYRRIPKNLMSG